MSQVVEQNSAQIAVVAQPDIPLQTLSPVNTAQEQRNDGNQQTSTHPDQAGQEDDQHSQRSDRTVSAWLWSRGYTIWSWVMSIIMLAITAATYVVTKVQTAMDSGQVIQQQMLSETQWGNRLKYNEYCKSEQAAGKSLTEACQSSLENGMEPPPSSHVKRGESSSNGVSQAQNKAKGIWRDVELRVAKTKHFLGENVPNPVLLIRGVRRRFARLFRGGRRLGSGQQTYSLPTFESSLLALSVK